MKVSALDSNNDWTFGKGRANYLRDRAAIAQNVVTRVRCFRNDWFPDMSYGVDWIELLGRPDNEQAVIRAVQRTALQTEGVVSVDNVEVVRSTRRRATISVTYTDVFNERIDRTVEIA